jgi:hypothetical protein
MFRPEPAGNLQINERPTYGEGAAMTTTEGNTLISEETSQAGTTGAQSTKIQYSAETITPDRAKALLAHAVNKDKDEKAIHKYAEAMKKGVWIENFQTIAISQDGKLLNGVQRLYACIEADTPFYTWVARNVREDTLHTIDQHRQRNFQGVLESRGVNFANTVLHTATRAIRLSNGVMGMDKSPISWGRYDNVINLNPEIQEAAIISHQQRSCPIRSTARPLLIAMALKAGHRAEILDFLREVSPDRYKDAQGTPAATYAMQVAIAKENKTNYSVEKTLALAILAFNDHLKKEGFVSHYSWEPDYGDAKLKKNGEPVSFTTLKDLAPPNLGMPEMIGFKGFDGAVYDIRAVVDNIDNGTDEELLAAQKENIEEKTIQEITVTPQMARELLRYNTGNRHVQDNHVNMLARDIKNGNWMQNAQPICFTSNPFAKGAEQPRLLNGQHRLMAIIKAKTPIDVPLAWGAPEAAFATFDGSSKRKAVLNGSDRADSRVTAASAKMLWKELNGFPLTGSGNTPSVTEIQKTIAEHPKLSEGYSRARSIGMRKLASAGVLTYAIYRIKREQPEWGEDFLNGLETGAGLEKGSIILDLRDDLRDNKASYSRQETIDKILDKWEEYKQQREAQAKSQQQEKLL